MSSINIARSETKNAFAAGASPDPAGGVHSAPGGPLAGLWGGVEKEGEERKAEGNGKGRVREWRGESKVKPLPSKDSGYGLVGV